MALKTPLIWDEARNVARQLESADGLQLGGGLGVSGPLGFYGETPVTTRPGINGDWGTTLTQALDALVAFGLLDDGRPESWGMGLDQVINLGELGAYETGRIIVGSTAGWTNLDMPAREPGVIQVPTAYAGEAEPQPTGGIRRRLAYSPVLSYGVLPPTAVPMIGALWFDSAARRLKVWSGTAWEAVNPPGLDSIQAALDQADYGRLLISDGVGGVLVLDPTPGDVAGLVPMANAAGGMELARLLTVSTAAPWANGTSAFGGPPNGGGRGPGLHHALWFNPAANAERLSVWDEASQLWKGVPLNSPLLQRLADLRSTIASGDLLAFLGSQLERLPVGTNGQSLTAVNGEPVWRSRFTSGVSAPVNPVEGDLWLDGSDGLWLRTASGWRDLQQTVRFQAANASGGTVLPGTALVHTGAQWELAGPATARDALVGTALASAFAGAPVSAGVSGVVSLSAAQWSAVIDSAEAHVPGSGLIPGRSYFVSELTAGMLTTQPAAGRELPVGLALSNTHLLLRPAAPLSARTARAGLEEHQPTSPLPGQFWWDPSLEALMIFIPGQGGAPGSWEPAVTGDGGGGGVPAPLLVSLTSVEAVSWATDPIAAALRFTLSDGSTTSIRLRGAGGASVTMSDNRTLVLDAGGSNSGGIREIDGGRFSL